MNRGEFISIYCTGLGPVLGAPATGRPATAATPLAGALPAVVIDGIAGTPSYAGLAPVFVGLYQVNVRVPDSARSSGNIAVLLRFGNQSSNTVTMAVQ